MKVCVQGLWHLGTVTAACLAEVGHDVTGLDFSRETIAALNQGRPPIFEPGLEDLVKKGLAAGRLAFSTDAETAVGDAELLWVTYDTPVDDDDSADVEYVVAEIGKAIPHLSDKATVLVSAQMPVGSIRRLESIAASRFPGKDLGFACSPENLRLGKALDVFLKPDRVVVGVRRDGDHERIERLLHPITERVEWMAVESAEMTKHAINAFLATSVTFANEIAAICEVVGADAKDVERGLKTEARIGPKAYLSPGSAFAGGTLARDIAFLNKAAGERHLATPLLASVKTSNDEHRHWVKRKLRTLFPALSGVTVAVWGLTYKPGTDTLRRSMAVDLCDWLVAQGASVRVHDPAVKTLPQAWRSTVRRSDDALGALEGARVLVIATPWPQYRDIAADAIAAIAPDLAVVDADRFLSPLSRDRRLRYVAVGTPN